MNQTGRILEEVKKAVCGKDHVLVWVLTVLLARGHVLLEDIPGVGKTTMALAFSRALGLEYGRVQFTPDYCRQILRAILSTRRRLASWSISRARCSAICFWRTS